MPVVGAVVVLSKQEPRLQEALAALAAEPRLLLGALEGDRLPLVATTGTGEEDEALWRDVLAVDGVLHADVVFAALDEAAESVRES